MRGLAALAAFGAMAIDASTSAAQDPQASDGARAAAESAIVVIVAGRDDPFGLRVAAELAQLGFWATSVEPPLPPGSPAPPDGDAGAPSDAGIAQDALAAVSRARGTVGVIRGAPAMHTVEIWVTDLASGKTLHQQLTDAGADDGALALRSVELLRAGLVEVKLNVPRPAPAFAPPPPPPTPSATATADARTAREPPRGPPFHGGVAPGVVLSPGGMSPTATLSVGASWMPSDHVGLVALGLLPIGSAELSVPEGRAELSAYLAGGGVRVAMLGPRSQWSPSIDIGFVGAWLHARTRSEALSSETDATTGAVFVRAGLGYAPIPRLRLRADVLAAWVGQGVEVRFKPPFAPDHNPARVMATWGQPLMVPSLGAEIGLFE